jgi:hypothetical protein
MRAVQLGLERTRDLFDKGRHFGLNQLKNIIERSGLAFRNVRRGYYGESLGSSISV